MVHFTMSSVEVIITIRVVINPYHLLIASQSVCHKSAIAVCMNILLVLFANTIASFVINNKVSIVENNIIPTHPDSPTLARDLTLDAPATITQVAVDPDGLLVEHFFAVLVAEHRFVATEVSVGQI